MSQRKCSYPREAFWRVPPSVKVTGKVACMISDDEVNAVYREGVRSFHHRVELYSYENFMLQPTVMTSGPWAGAKALVVVPCNHFPFQRLPAELREMIYDTLMGGKKNVRISASKDHRGRYLMTRHITLSKSQFPVEPLALLLTSRSISREARKFYYWRKHFVFDGVANFNLFMQQIGTAKRYLTEVTVERSGTSLLRDCYSQLLHADRLQAFTITLPVNFKGTLVEHIEEHWKWLKIYLLGGHADLEESLSCLEKMAFTVGSQQTSVRKNNGEPIKRITTELNDLCKARLVRKVQEHFANSPNSTG